MRTLSSSSATAASLAVLLLITVSSGTSSGQPAQRSVPVLIDFRAVTDDGQPVLDLKGPDVMLKVDGRARDVKSLQLIQRAAGARTNSPLPPPFSSNALSDASRDLVLLIDDDSIAPGREPPVREAVAHLTAGLTGRDRVALFGVRPGGLNVGLTSDRARIRSALTSMVGQARSSESAGDVTCRTRLALQTLQAALGKTAWESPPTVVFFSSGLSAPDSSVRTNLATGSALCIVTPNDYQQVATAVTASRTDFYVVIVVDGAASTASSSLTAGMESLAGVTGAQIIRLTGSSEAAMTRVTREASSYYVLAFDPEGNERNGATHRVEVRVGRDRMKVRARPEVVIAKAGAAAAGPRDMLRTADVFRDLPLRAAAYASRGSDDKSVKVVTLFEPHEPSTMLSAAMIGLYDEKGKLTAQWTAQPAELSKSPVVAALTAPPGLYRLRVAATDSAGRSGSTDYELRAQLKPADPLRTSAMMLGVPQSGSFLPKLQFGADPAAVAAVEIYGVPKGAALTVQLELAASEQGPAMATAPASLGAGPSEDARAAYGGFTIGPLDPGDYMLRAILLLDGKEAGRVTQTLRKVAAQ